MRIRIGTDLVHIPKFERSMRGENGKSPLERIFTTHELKENSSLETLAGAFAAKEAVIKALGLPAGSFLKMEIVKSDAGRPEVRFTNPPVEILSQDISISHDGEYAMAIAVFLTEKQRHA